MAQQTQRRPSGDSSARSRTRSSSANGRTAARSRSSSSRSQNAKTSQRKRRSRVSSGRSKASSSNNKSPVDAAKDATVKGANAASNAVMSAAKKLKTPAIAAGAGLAGVAGGIALTRGKDKKVLGVSLPNRSTARLTAKNLADAAKNLGTFAERTGQVAEQVRVVSEAIGENSARPKSPIEVVLDGLTSRSHSRSG
jgi:hypothetical protein